MKFENKIPAVITIGGKDVNKIRINAELRLNEGIGDLTVSGTNTLIAIKSAKP